MALTNLKSSLGSVGSSLRSAASNIKSSTTRSSSSSLSSGLSSIGSSLRSAASNIKSSTTGSSSSSLSSGLSSIGSSLRSSGLSGTSTISKVASNVSDRINKLCGTSAISTNLGSTYSNLTNKVSSGGILSSISSAFKSSSRGSNNGGLISGLINKYASKGSLGGTNTRIGSLQGSSGGTMSSILKGSNGTPILSSLKSIFDTNSSSRGVVSSAIEKLKNNISIRTSGAGVLSNLLSNSRGLLNKDGSGLARISNLNVFGGLKNLISNVKGNITGGDATSRMDTMGVLGLSTILSGTSSRIRDSFESWKTKLSNLTGSGLMSGVIESSSGVASGEMTGLFGRFRDYAQNMSNRLFGISEKAAGVDNKYAEPLVLGAYDDLDALSTKGMLGVPGSTKDHGVGSSSSEAGVLGATDDLSKPDKSVVDLAMEVMNGKYGNGDARKKALGDDYNAVQAEINNYLKTGKWSTNSSTSTGTTKTTTTQQTPKATTTQQTPKTTTTTSGNGKTTEIPDSVRQTGIIANYTQNYNTRGWGYDQGKMAEAYKNAGNQTDGNIATIDGRYLVAVSPKFGKVGDNIDIQLENGETIPAVIADVKGKDATSSWGHELGGEVDVVEWEINGTSQDNLKTTLKDNNWYGSEVVSITNTGSGNYF